MLSVTLYQGEGVQIGESPQAGAYIKVAEKSGRRVKLAIATELDVQRIAPGLVPEKFTTGISGRPARILTTVG